MVHAAFETYALRAETGWRSRCNVSWMRWTKTRPHLTPLLAMPTCTAATATGTGAPGQQPWSRLHLFGPAFFTKFLYFCGPGALILDNRLANAVYRLSRLPYLVTGERPLAGMDAIPLLGLPSLDGAGGPNSGG
jgi:hypothetical protein